MTQEAWSTQGRSARQLYHYYYVLDNSVVADHFKWFFADFSAGYIKVNGTTLMLLDFLVPGNPVLARHKKSFGIGSLVYGGGILVELVVLPPHVTPEYPTSFFGHACTLKSAALVAVDELLGSSHKQPYTLEEYAIEIARRFRQHILEK